MIYLKSFDLMSESAEEDFLLKLRRTCYSTIYPFKLFPPKRIEHLEFEQITIFYGGNGSGKSTLLNIIAETLKLNRSTVFNTSPFYENYIAKCHFEMEAKKSVPRSSKIITSDDVFDYLINLRYINAGIDFKRDALFEEYTEAKYSKFQLKSLDDYEELKRRNSAKNGTQSNYVRERLMRNVQEQSNGESAFRYFTQEIKENAIYLLDEPENSLSAKLQLELKQFIEESTRYYGCQFILSSHSSMILSIKNANIYDLDARPVCVRNWTELENVRIFYDFFKNHEIEFSK